MKILETKHKRKSAAITAILLFLLLYVVFNFGMQYLDPPEEYGLAINFGDANVGSGEPLANTKNTPSKQVQKKEAVVEKMKETSKEVIKEAIITNQTKEDVPVVEKVKEVKKEPVKEIVKKEVTPKEKPKPKPSKEAKEALNALLNGNSNNGKPKGKGDDKVKGVKGKKEGDVTTTKYYRNVGNSSVGNYNLQGRKALSKPTEQPDCEEEGIVVVEIIVDKNGNVISAIPGVKGTTNSSPCLYKPAKEAALKTKWNADTKAPSKQTGTIIYKFSLK